MYMGYYSKGSRRRKYFCRKNVKKYKKQNYIEDSLLTKFAYITLNDGTIAQAVVPVDANGNVIESGAGYNSRIENLENETKL